MKEEDFYNLCEDVNDLKHEITLLNTNSNNISLDVCQYNNVTYDLVDRVDSLEKKINEIYSILFNAKRLDLSDLDN